MPLDWDDDTKIAAKEELQKPAIKDRDRAYLIVLAGNSVGEMYKIAKSETIIGRGSQADIHVVDVRISTHHAIYNLLESLLNIKHPNKDAVAIGNAERLLPKAGAGG